MGYDNSEADFALAGIPMTGSFDSVRLKLARAKEHIDHLKREITAYHASKPYLLITEDQVETGQRLTKVGAIERPIPTQLPLIVGDAVHNLRSALDHFAYGIVSAPGRDTAFPVWRKLQRPTVRQMESVVAGKVGGASKDMKQALAAVQPYLGGNGEYVWAIDYLDVVDKHRLILAVGAYYSSFTIDFGDLVKAHFATLNDPDFKPENAPSIPISLRPAQTYPVAVGTILFQVPLSAAEAHQNMKFTLDISLGEPEVLKGKPVVPTLAELTDRVEDLIKNLIRLA